VSKRYSQEGVKYRMMTRNRVGERREKKGGTHSQFHIPFQKEELRWNDNKVTVRERGVDK